MFILLSLLACDPATAPTAPTAPTPGAAVAPTAAPASPSSTAPASGTITGVVQETLPAGSYTYTRAKPAAGDDVWVAATGAPPAVGSTVVISTHLPMREFHSDTLNRDFPLVYFVESLGGANSTSPAAWLEATAPAAEAPAAASPAPVTASGPPAGAKKIAEVWADRAALAGREVTITRKVVKSTSGVLGHTWLHVQDGSGAEGTNDLTITTSANAAVGDSVIVRGIVAIDQDFGAGYVYPVLVADAAVTVAGASAP